MYITMYMYIKFASLIIPNYIHFQSVLRKVTPEDAPEISDPIMTSLLQMLSSSTGKVGGIQEDALLAVSTLVESKRSSLEA